MDLKLAGKSVLITGASKGIGLSCAKVLAKEGCTLHLAARGKKALELARVLLEPQCREKITLHCVDLSAGNQVRKLAESCQDIDVLINNAGAIPSGDLWQIEEEQWREAWDLKVFGYINMCRTVYQQMKEKKKGVILNIIGAGGERPTPGYIAGGSANAGLMAFTKALGSKSLKDGIRVVGINPGLIRTERLEMLFRSIAQGRFGDPEQWEELLPVDPRPGLPEDIAYLAAFLASDRAKNITGTIVTSDGGFSAC